MLSEMGGHSYAIHVPTLSPASRMVAPLIDSRRKCFLSYIFGKLEIAIEPDQSRNNPSPVGSIDLFNLDVYVREHTQG